VKKITSINEADKYAVLVQKRALTLKQKKSPELDKIEQTIQKKMLALKQQQDRTGDNKTMRDDLQRKIDDLILTVDAIKYLRTGREATPLTPVIKNI